MTILSGASESDRMTANKKPATEEDSYSVVAAV